MNNLNESYPYNFYNNKPIIFEITEFGFTAHHVYEGTKFRGYGSTQAEAAIDLVNAIYTQLYGATS